MKKILPIILVLFLGNNIFSQKTCNSPEENLEDLNSIAKCTIEPSKKSKSKRARQISVKISASKMKKRFLKNRNTQKTAASTNSNIATSGVANLNTSASMSNSLLLKTNLENISNKLSLEELHKAEKFTTVDKIPVFTACKNAEKDAQIDCFNTEMVRHIQKHFHYPNEAVVRKIEGNVWVRFIIDKNGNISNIKALSRKETEILDNEAKRVVSLLPKFLPATKEGKNVAVKYGFPVSFYLGQE